MKKLLGTISNSITNKEIVQLIINDLESKKIKKRLDGSTYKTGTEQRAITLLKELYNIK